MFRADIAAIRDIKGRVLPFLFPHLFAVAMYRLSSALRARRLVRSARVVAIIGQLLTGAELAPEAEIGPGLFLCHTTGVIVGPGVIAGARLRLFSGALLGSTFNDSGSKRPELGFPTIGDDVLVLAKASILGPVIVGDRAVIGAHALVLDDVPADAVARGIPAKSFPRQ